MPVATAKATFNAAANHKLIGFYQYQTKEQPDYLGAIRIAGGRQSPALMTKDTVWHSTLPAARVEGGVQRGAVAVAVLRGARRRLPLGVGARGQVDRRRASRTSATTSSRAACGPPTSGAIGRRPTRSLCVREERLGRQPQLQARRRGDARSARPAVPRLPGPDPGRVGAQQQRGDPGRHLPARLGIEERPLDLLACSSTTRGRPRGG